MQLVLCILFIGLDVSGFALSNTNQFQAKCELLRQLTRHECEPVKVFLPIIRADYISQFN